jgi:hypothetical protein
VEGGDPHRSRLVTDELFRISSAALLVKVMASIRTGGTPSARIRAIRLVSTRVFPEPAPATIASGPSSYKTAARCAGFKSATSSSRRAALSTASDGAS